MLNGSKCFISGGSVSDLYLVMCKTAENEVSCILVEKGTPGLSFGKLEEKMGWRSSPTTMVMFQDCRVPKRNLLGKEGHGFKMAMSALDGGRINIGSCSLGGAALAFDLAKDYMHGERCLMLRANAVRAAAGELPSPAVQAGRHGHAPDLVADDDPCGGEDDR